MRTLRCLSFALVVALAAATPAFAQDGGVGFGVHFGMTVPTFDVVTGGDAIDGRNGLMGGIWFGGNRNGTVGFTGEISYLVKKGNLAATDQELKFQYLEIPALVRVNLGSHKKNGLVIYPLVGPVVDIQLKGELDGFDVKDQFNGFDFGVIGGVGVEVARIGVEVRGNWGVRSLISDDGGSTFGDLKDSKNFMVQVIGKIRIN